MAPSYARLNEMGGMGGIGESQLNTGIHLFVISDCEHN